MKSRRFGAHVGLGSFGVGLMAGALSVALWHTQGARARLQSDTSCNEIQPVRGTSSGALSTGRESLERVAPRQAAVDTLDSARVARDLEPSGSAASVGRHAREFTAFIRGGNVYGSGVYVDPKGLVLTSFHVVDGLDEIHVSYADGFSETAELVDHDTRLDLALLRVGPGRKSAPTSSATSMDVGDVAYSMGAPRKLKFSLGRGMVSFTGRPFDDVLFLQTDIPTNSGNSGGPVMNASGKVVAVQSFILRDSEGLAFAVPIDYAYQRFAEHLGEPTTLSLAEFETWVAARRPEPARASGSLAQAAQATD